MNATPDATRRLSVALLLLSALSPMKLRAAAVTPAEARALAREACVYGFPLVDNYRVQYAYFVDRQDPDYKAPYNQLFNIPRVYTPEDKAIQTPNSDKRPTPGSASTCGRSPSCSRCP